MYVDNKNFIYYLTVMNEKYKMPEMPPGIEQDILKGMYRFQKSDKKEKKKKVHLLGSGAILRETISAAKILEEEYSISADVWSVTSYKELYNDAQETERNNIRNNKRMKNFIETSFDKEEGEVFVAASDYVKAVPLTVAKWFPGDFYALGTDGFGRSDNRKALRDYFEVDDRHIAYFAISGLVKKGILDENTLKEAQKKLKIDRKKVNPLFI